MKCQRGGAVNVGCQQTAAFLERDCLYVIVFCLEAVVISKVTVFCPIYVH